VEVVSWGQKKERKEIDKQVAEAIMERDEKEKRKNNVIIKGLKKKKGAELKQEVEEILEIIGAKPRINEIVQLGKVEDTDINYKPILVKLANKDDKYNILKLASKLKDHESTKGVFIVMDLTLNQRKEEYELRQERNKRNQEAGKSVWGIRKGELKKID
jgi:hypothetical protein